MPLLFRTVFFAALSASAGCADPSATRKPNAADDAPGQGHGPRWAPHATGLSHPLLPPVPSDGPQGTWYLDAGGRRLTFMLRCGLPALRCEATLSSESAADATGASSEVVGDPVDGLAWDRRLHELRFRHSVDGTYTWYRARITDGVLLGRYAASLVDPTEPTDPTLYSGHVSGWKAETFGADIAPRVYDLLVGDEFLTTLRIDRAAGGDSQRFEGRFKVYTTASATSGEELLHDAEITRWDGTNLEFTVRDPSWTLRFYGTAHGRFLDGTYLQDGDDPSLVKPFRGTRAEVLSHGFTDRTPVQRDEWQLRARRQLLHLMMADNPAPLSTTVTELGHDLDPIAPETDVVLPTRDDGDLDTQPRDYRLTELQLDYTLADPAGGPAIARRTHGFVARPTATPPARGFPAVIAVNGHIGSARQMLEPDNEAYWYGESYARHGYVVMAIDTGHRPLSDRRGLYDAYEDGDDPANGNGLHPAIRGAGMDSDWEEDGERVWDILRALDYLLAQPGVDASRVIVTGLSLGAEVATFAAALDPRFAMAIPAGFSPDWSVLLYRGSHGCWQWANGSIREYIDPSDLHALIAPRPLLVETGKADYIYSAFKPPFADDKQVMRRSRSFYADVPERVVHFLHYDGHAYHIGGYNPGAAVEPDVRTPLLIAPALSGPDGLDWQGDATTIDTGETVYDVIARLLPAKL